MTFNKILWYLRIISSNVAQCHNFALSLLQFSKSFSNIFGLFWTSKILCSKCKSDGERQKIQERNYLLCPLYWVFVCWPTLSQLLFLLSVAMLIVMAPQIKDWNFSSCSQQHPDERWILPTIDFVSEPI